jgi:hypothetical protein
MKISFIKVKTSIPLRLLALANAVPFDNCPAGCLNLVKWAVERVFLTFSCMDLILSV